MLGPKPYGGAGSTPSGTPFKIALFLPFLPGGGAERVMLTVASGLREEGVDVDLVLGNASGPFVSEIPPSVNVVDLRARRTALAIVPLARYLRKARPSVMISTLDHANIIALAAVRLSRAGTRTIIREANTFSIDAHGFLRRIVPLAYRLANGFIAVSAGVAEDLAVAAHVAPGAVRVIYNPVLSPSFRSMASEEITHPWFAEGQPPVVLAAGRLSAQKDFATLLRAFALARRSRPIRLMILGEGEARPDLERLAEELSISPDFSLPGFVLNPFPYMRRAAVFVLSSAWEGLPNVLIQAIAVGTPVVATDCKSGPREICEGVPSSLLVPVGCPGEMAGALEVALGMEHNSALPPSIRRFELRTAVREYLEFAQAIL